MNRITLLSTLCMLWLSNSLHAQTGLIAYWPFDGNANDSSGNGNNGIVHGAIPSADRFGRPGKAYYFDGTSHILVPNSSSLELGGTDFTVSFWMKVSPQDYDGIPLSKNQWGGWNGYLFFTRNQNSGYCTIRDHMSFYAASGAYGDVCSGGIG